MQIEQRLEQLDRQGFRFLLTEIFCKLSGASHEPTPDRTPN
jgi:hypothetical protein